MGVRAWALSAAGRGGAVWIGRHPTGAGGGGGGRRLCRPHGVATVQGRPRFRHGQRALDSRRRTRADRRSEVTRGSSRWYCRRGRAWPVRRARARGRDCRLGWRARRRAALSGYHRKRSVLMFANPIARSSCAIIIALGLTFAVRVGGADAQQQPSATAIATAKEVITVKGATALWEPIVPGVIEQAKSVFVQANPTLLKELNEVALKLRAEYAPRSAEVVNDVAKLYASRFTEQELKDTLAFYKSPLGRKLLVEEPSTLDQSMRNAQSWADRLSQEVIGKIRSEMKRRGHEI